jgi:hypothetical protein
MGVTPGAIRKIYAQAPPGVFDSLSEGLVKL